MRILILFSMSEYKKPLMIKSNRISMRRPSNVNISFLKYNYEFPVKKGDLSIICRLITLSRKITAVFWIYFSLRAILKTHSEAFSF